MKKEEVERIFSGVIDISFGSFYRYPVCVVVWIINILATALIVIKSDLDTFLAWMIVTCAEVFLLIIISSYTNFFWAPKRKKEE